MLSEVSPSLFFFLVRLSAGSFVTFEGVLLARRARGFCLSWTGVYEKLYINEGCLCHSLCLGTIQQNWLHAGFEKLD